MRPQLQSMMASVNRMLPDGAVQDMVQNLLSQIRNANADSMAATAPSDGSARQTSPGIPRTVPTAAAQSENACAVVKQWIATNNAEDVKMHPAFSRFVRTLKMCLCTCPEKTRTCPAHVSSTDSISLDDLFFHIGNCMYECVSEMVPLVALGGNMINDLMDSAEDPPSFPETIGFLMTTQAGP